MGDEPKVKEAIALVEGIKGEKPLAPMKGTCAACRYACRFAGKQEGELPAWLRRTGADVG
jgi:hypothetical protein